MFIHIKSNVIFQNRKQAIILMGKKRYGEALKNNEFQFNN